MLCVFLNTTTFSQEQSKVVEDEFVPKRHLKNCTLVPVTDNVAGALSFRVFDSLDKELKASNWCSYRSNSGILAVFSNYRDKVTDYIDRPELLKVVAEKLDVGSIIRVALESRVGGVAVRVVVYINDGKDVFFDEQIFLQDDNIDVIIQQIKDWIQQYSQQLPYEGIISGVLGEQITVDLARNTGLKLNQNFIVRRAVKGKKHPLLNKVVDWDTLMLAKGKIFNLADNQFIGIVKVYTNEVGLKKGDWVSVEKMPFALDESITEDELKKNEFGKLGIAAFALQAGNYGLNTYVNGSKKFEGLFTGVHLEGDFWITRNYFTRLVLERGFGQMDKTTDNVTNSSLSMTPSTFKLLGGYKILPMGYFYGPQIDLYIGYGNYLYDTTYSASDGGGENSFSGITSGIKVDMPLTKGVRGYVRTEFILMADFNEGDDIYGNEKSVSSLYFSLGGVYDWSPIIGVLGEVEVVSNKARFDDLSAKEIQYQSTLFKLGLTYQF